MSGAATLKRGSPARRTRAATRGRTRKPAAKRPSIFARALAHVPVKPETVQRAATAAVLLAGAAAILFIATMLGVPRIVGNEFAEMTARAGFEVKRVEVTGIDRMERLTVYAVALDQHSMAMPLVDLDKVRGQLLEYGWIQDARVTRRLPDTLVVDIVERKPAAIWQHNQELSLIDKDGVVLEPVALDAMPDLPLVIGPDANRRATALTALLGEAPALKPVLAGATWVGGRRWDLRFQSGEVLALPEGEKAAAEALARFAQMDGAQRLLGRGFVRFDMRDPTKFVVRVGKERPAIDTPAPGAQNT